MAAMLLGLTGFATRTYGQSTRMEQGPIAKARLDAQTASMSLHIRGQVIDESGDAIPGARVTLDSTSAITDVDGNFLLPLAAEQQWPVYLSLQSFSSGDTVVQINKSDISSSILKFRMPMSDNWLGEVVIVKRHRSLWYRLTKPFRKR